MHDSNTANKPMAPETIRILLKLAGEHMQFIYNTITKEVCNPMFPGIPVHKVTLACGHVLPHDTLSKILEIKYHTEYRELVESLAAEISQFVPHKDHSDSF